jgi:hypothetical protein
LLSAISFALLGHLVQDHGASTMRKPKCICIFARVATLVIVLLRSIFNFLQVMQIFSKPVTAMVDIKKKIAAQANFFGLT